MPIFKKCCYCCPLPTGCAVLGWMDLMINVVLFILLGSVLESLEALRNSQYKDSQLVIEIETIYLTKSNIGIFLGIKLVCCVAAITLIVGAMQRKKIYLIPYLVSNSVYVICIFVGMILLSIETNDWTKLSIVMLLFFNMGINLYLWLCVMSLYQELLNKEKLEHNAQLMQQLDYHSYEYIQENQLGHRRQRTSPQSTSSRSFV